MKWNDFMDLPDDDFLSVLRDYCRKFYVTGAIPQDGVFGKMYEKYFSKYESDAMHVMERDLLCACAVRLNRYRRE